MYQVHYQKSIDSNRNNSSCLTLLLGKTSLFSFEYMKPHLSYSQNFCQVPHQPEQSPCWKSVLCLSFSYSSSILPVNVLERKQNKTKSNAQCLKSIKNLSHSLLKEQRVFSCMPSVLQGSLQNAHTTYKTQPFRSERRGQLLKKWPKQKLFQPLHLVTLATNEVELQKHKKKKKKIAR